MCGFSGSGPPPHDTPATYQQFMFRHFLARGSNKGARAPKESKSETPNLIAPRGDGGFWSCLAKKFFGPSSIFWHIMRNFHRGVPYPQNLAPKNDQFSALPQTRLECPHEKFSPLGIFRGSRPLSNAEEGVQKSAPKPEIGEKILRGDFGDPLIEGSAGCRMTPIIGPGERFPKIANLGVGVSPFWRNLGLNFSRFCPISRFLRGFWGQNQCLW